MNDDELVLDRAMDEFVRFGLGLCGCGSAADGRDDLNQDFLKS